jgi:CDP-glucose 4,6-dehydratase
MQALWPDLRSEPDPGPHPHEAQSLRLDCAKAAQKLAWRGVWDAVNTIDRTARWYRAYYEDGSLRSNEDLGDYVRNARAAGLEWAA